MFWFKANSPKLFIAKARENFPLRDKKYSRSIRALSKMEPSSTPIKIDRIHSPSYSARAELSRAGTRDSPACAREKKPPSSAPQSMPTEKEALHLKFLPILL